MTYKVSVLARYTGGSELKLEFDTKTKLFHEAHMDAKIELFGARSNAGQNPFETPVFLHVNLEPF